MPRWVRNSPPDAPTLRSPSFSHPAGSSLPVSSREKAVRLPYLPPSLSPSFRKSTALLWLRPGQTSFSFLRCCRRRAQTPSLAKARGTPSHNGLVASVAEVGIVLLACGSGSGGTGSSSGSRGKVIVGKRPAPVPLLGAEEYSMVGSTLGTPGVQNGEKKG